MGQFDSAVQLWAVHVEFIAALRVDTDGLRSHLSLSYWVIVFMSGHNRWSSNCDLLFVCPPCGE